MPGLIASPKDFPRTGWLYDSRENKVNEADLMKNFIDSFTPFNESKVVERTQIFSLSAVYPLSVLRDVYSGDVTHATDEYQIGPGGNLESAELIRYVPGFPAEMGIGFRLGSSSSEGRWGAYTNSDGFFWEKTQANGYEIGIRKDNVDTKIKQADWNIDSLDGSGPSGLDLSNGTDGFIFQVTYTYYGYGPVVWWVMDNRTGTSTKTWIAHIEGEFTGGTSISNSNLPVRAENIGASGNVFCAGRQASIIGKFTPSERPTSLIFNGVSVSDTWSYIASVRKQANNDPHSFRAKSISISNSTASDIVIALILNPTLTGATWDELPELRSASETKVEFDVAATDFSGGEIISDIPIIQQGSGTPNNIIRSVGGTKTNIVIPRYQPAALIAKALEPGGSSMISGVFTVAEEW